METPSEMYVEFSPKGDSSELYKRYCSSERFEPTPGHRVVRYKDNIYDYVPWKDCSKWEPGLWYPMPVGSMWISKPTVVEGYDIFMQDPEEPEDMIPVDEVSITLTFRVAVELCEHHNRKKFTELKGRD